MSTDWIYYNHALLPDVAPHENVDPVSVYDGMFTERKFEGYPLLAFWTSGFDCKEKTDWWYIIKDSPFDISSVKAKRRYVINKGTKNFEVKVINPAKYIDELYQVMEEAFKAYPAQSRPSIDLSYKEVIPQWPDTVFAGFDRTTGAMCGFARIIEDKVCIKFNVLKALPSEEKREINAAIVYAIMKYYEKALESGTYILDGHRALFHETAFQDYLEKYFGFRKAYCRLHLKYRFPFNMVINCIYPFRELLWKLNLRCLKPLSCILQYEHIKRMCEQT